MQCLALELAGHWVELGLSVETEISGRALADWYYLEPEGLWWTNVLNSALPPQRLRPDTWLEHQDPVSHTAVGLGVSPGEVGLAVAHCGDRATSGRSPREYLSMWALREAAILSPRNMFCNYKPLRFGDHLLPQQNVTYREFSFVFADTSSLGPLTCASLIPVMHLWVAVNVFLSPCSLMISVVSNLGPS